MLTLVKQKILLILVAIAAVVGIGYYVLAQQGLLSVPGVSLTPRATEKDFAFIEDATLRKHFVAQANKTDYRTKTVSPGLGLALTNEAQIRGESFKAREIENDGTKEIKHMITIDDTIYLKDYSDNKWWKQTIKPEEVTEEEKPEEPTDFKEEYSKPNISYKSLGKEACGPSAEGLTCFRYEQTLPENPEMKRIFWFDDKNYLLRKDQSGYGEFITTIEYSYDGINIQAPSPTKDVPEGKSIYEYSLGSDTKFPSVPNTDQAPSAAEIERIQKQFPEQNQDTNYNYDSSSNTNSDNN